MSTTYSTEATPKQVQFLLSLWKQLNEVVVDTQDPASNWSGDDDQTLKADTLLGKTLTDLDKPAITKFVNGNKVNLSTAEVIGYTEAGGAIEKSEISTAIDTLKRLLDSAKADRATWGLPTVAPEWASKYPSVPADAERVVPARFASKCSVCGKRDQYIAYLKAGWHALCQNCAHNDGKIDDAIDKIDAALPGVNSLDTADNELDELADLAKDKFEDLMDLGMQVEARYSGTIFQTAGVLLGHAITAKQAKLDKKLRMVDLQLKKLRLDQVAKKEAANGDLPQEPVDGKGMILDRNELLRSILAQRTDTKTTKSTK